MIPDQYRTTEQIFPVLIHVSRPPEPEVLNQHLLGEIEAIRAATPNGKPESWGCDVYTTMTNAGSLQTLPPFKKLIDFSMMCANYFGEIMCQRYNDRALVMTSCWLNIYSQGHSQEIHYHPNHIITGVYFVKAPPGSASLVFHSPYYKSMSRPELTEETLANSVAVPYPPSEGDLIIFDSAVRHSVPLHTVLDERISISFNIALGAPNNGS